MAKIMIEVDDEKLPDLMEQMAGILDAVSVDDVADGPSEVEASVVAAIGGEGWKPDPSFFADPKLDSLQRWTSVTAEGRIFGHVAGWGECHIGYTDRCITPELLSDGGFDYANGIGHVVASNGEQIATAPLAIKGGHADTSLDYKAATKHYDDPDSVIADVTYGADEHGIWFSGGLRPAVTPEQVYSLRASGVSGDWRQIDGKLRFLAACCVNLPGYPKMTARVASGEVEAVVATGGEPQPDPELVKDCGCEKKTLEERVASLEKFLEPSLLASLQGRLNGETANGKVTITSVS